MILIILASGSGKRLKNKTKKIPKCLVKVNGKPIIEYMQKFINCFDKIFVITGYRSDKIKKFFNNKKVKVIYNKKYNSTNMVHSLFCASKYIKEDVIVSYSDIIFDYSIFHSLKRKKFNSIPVKTNWLKLWKKRMPISKIKKDAESLSSNGNKLISIGEKITKKFPKYQFMGLIKIIYKDFILMKKYYDKINNKKIDFTSFINLMLKDKKIKIHCLKTNKFWLEIDNLIEFSRSIGGSKTNVLQLIELVPNESLFYRKYNISLDSIENDLKNRAIASTERVSHRRPKYELENGVTVEIVRPMHNTKFCMGCNRMRITYDGKFKPCLLRNHNHIDFLSSMRLGADDAKIREIFKKAVSIREPFFKIENTKLTDTRFKSTK